MFWSRSAILLVVLIAALLNVAAGLSVSSAGAESAVSQCTTGSSQAVPPLPMKVHQVQLQRRNKGKKPGHVKNASRTEGPSGQELIPQVKAHFKELLKKSAFSKTIVQELGGWIYADSADPRRIKVVDAPKDRSRPSQDKPAPAAKGSKAPAPLQNLAINLENPQAGGVPANYVLVANYHTHPSQQGDPSLQVQISGMLGQGVSWSRHR
ncbi:hypothetical protein BC829DRAFT_421790 [Chytridium lagenaria]|nr:hypothetical protein BC829DRAFT_421790 [Chytridium lagenaria]